MRGQRLDGYILSILTVTLIVTLLVLTSSRALPHSTSAPPVGREPAALTWPLTVRYSETVSEDGEWLGTTHFQFSGESWDQWVVVTLGIEDERGMIARAQTGYIVRYSHGLVELGYLPIGEQDLLSLSSTEVHELVASLSERDIELATNVDRYGQAPSMLFNLNWMKDWRRASKGSIPLREQPPTMPPSTELASAAYSARTRTAALSDVPESALVPAFSGGAIGPEDTTFAILLRDVWIPMYAETQYKGVSSELSVQGLHQSASLSMIFD